MGDNSGWISLHRKILDNPIWLLSTPEQKAILITVLLMINHKEKEWEWKGEKYICQPGQVITSLDKIAKKAGKGISIQNVRTALSRFEKYEFLTNESTKQSRLITICKWDKYQSEKEEPNKAANNQLTDDQQTPNNQLTTNNNDNNDNKNITIGGKSKRFIPPAIEEIKSYCLERGNKISPEMFFDFYTSNGWMAGKNKMKDWKASVRTWEKRDEQKRVSLHPACSYNNHKKVDERWKTTT